MTYSLSSRAGLLLLISIASAFLFAAVFVLVFHLTLPPSDLAYGEPIAETFTDPLVTGVASVVAICSGVLAFPAYYFCLRKRRLLVCVPIVTASVLVELVIFTAAGSVFGWLLSYPTLLGALLICWAAGRTTVTPTCRKCGYDLRGTAGSRCPECGGAVAGDT